MNESDDKGLRNGPNDDCSTDPDDETEELMIGGDLVITSSASAGAWMSATYPVDLTEAQ
jgi:hypothetical protein